MTIKKTPDIATQDIGTLGIITLDIGILGVVMNELALFAGAGGGILGSKLLGFRTVCAVEIEPYCREVLLRRQRDSLLPLFPIWDNIRTIDGGPWRGKVDIITGGFPCQDISVAGRGAGIEGERSGLWSEMFRVVCEVGPRFVFVENSPALTCRGLGRVLGDLASVGFDAKWGVLGAHHVGAPHRRDRIWILANSRCEYGESRHARRIQKNQDEWPSCNLYDQSSGQRQHFSNSHSKGELQQIRILEQKWGRISNIRSEVSNTTIKGFKGLRATIGGKPEYTEPSLSGWWESEPELGRVAHGMANRVDRLKAIGNGQVPTVAASAFRILKEMGEMKK